MGPSWVEGEVQQRRPSHDALRATLVVLPPWVRKSFSSHAEKVAAADAGQKPNVSCSSCCFSRLLFSWSVVVCAMLKIGNNSLDDVDFATRVHRLFSFPLIDGSTIFERCSTHALASI